MNSKKVHMILVGLLVLLGVGIFAGAYEANVLLTGKSKTLADLKTNEQATEQQKLKLKQDKKDIAKYTELNTIAKTVVPQDKDQAEAVREIVKLATDSGISKLSSIAFAPSTLGGPAGAQVKTSSGITQVTPVKGIPGVYDLQITVTQAPTDLVPYGNFTTFLSKLEQNRRTAQVSSINVQPDAKDQNKVSFTLVIDEFIKP